MFDNKGFWPDNDHAKPILNVAFENFWDTDEVIWEHYFKTSHCFLWEQYDVRYNPTDPDVVFCSIFTTRARHSFKPTVPRILLVHEPAAISPHPSLKDYKAIFSFSNAPDVPNNIRIPYWVYRIFDIYASQDPDLREPNFRDYLNNEYIFEHECLEPRYRFCGLVAGKPVEWRDEVVKWLNEYKTVDCGGSLGFNLEPGSGEEEYMKMRLKGREANEQKTSFMARRLFGICMENTMDMPGYTTEKIIDVSYAGCIPIYAGQFDPADGFNSKKILNVYDFDSKADFMDAVKAIDNSGEEQAAMRTMPLFDKYPDQFTLEGMLDTYTRVFE